MKSMIINRSIFDLGIPDKVLGLLPNRLADSIKRMAEERCDRLCEEIRIRRGRRSSLTVSGGVTVAIDLEPPVSRQEMDETVSRISGGSLYAHSETIKQGYIALGNGIRAGICGRAAYDGGKMIGVDDISGICIRIPHTVYPDVSLLCDMVDIDKLCGGIMIYSPPGEGKTTLLRALSSELARRGKRIVVVDSRGELEYGLAGNDLCLDILSGYSKSEGIEIALRTLGAEIIVCDEIGSREDIGAICEASVGGAILLASAHAPSVAGLINKKNIKTLVDAGVFSFLVGIERKNNRFEYQVADVKELMNI